MNLIFLELVVELCFLVLWLFLSLLEFLLALRLNILCLLRGDLVLFGFLRNLFHGFLGWALFFLRLGFQIEVYPKTFQKVLVSVFVLSRVLALMVEESLLRPVFVLEWLLRLLYLLGRLFRM